MWIDPRSQQVYRTHAEVRAARPNTSFTVLMGDAEIESTGLRRVVGVTPPQVNPITHGLNELAPALVGGVWTQRWQTVALPPAQANANLAAARAWVADQIRAIRDRKAQNGGYPAGGKWFHSDTFSRVQQMGLRVLGQGVPGGIQWKTMDGSFVQMTPPLVQQVFEAAMNQDLALFQYAETLIAQVDSAADPTSIDIEVGWPATYGGV